uniref:Putative glutathione s-transferase n=1 Tax=Ixodes ricinus TaxID=34613 RepID=A0A090XAK5_IXORI
MPIDLYATRTCAPSVLVKMVAKHIGVDLNIKIVDMAKKEHLTPEFLKMNPYHKVPTMCDDGFVLFESTAICLYLLNKYKPGSELYPKDVQKRARVDQFMAIVTSCFQPRFSELFRSSLVLRKKPTAEQIKVVEDFALQGLEDMMGSSKFAVGDELTLADLTLVAHLGFMYKERLAFLTNEDKVYRKTVVFLTIASLLACPTTRRPTKNSSKGSPGVFKDRQVKTCGRTAYSCNK